MTQLTVSLSSLAVLEIVTMSSSSFNGDFLRRFFTLKQFENQPKNVFDATFQVSKFARCLKNTDKVSFNIASEASYVYILSGQKLIKNAKNSSFWRVFENLKLAVKQCHQTGQF